MPLPCDGDHARSVQCTRAGVGVVEWTDLPAPNRTSEASRFASPCCSGWERRRERCSRGEHVGNAWARLPKSKEIPSSYCSVHAQHRFLPVFLPLPLLPGAATCRRQNVWKEHVEERVEGVRHVPATRGVVSDPAAAPAARPPLPPLPFGATASLLVSCSRRSFWFWAPRLSGRLFCVTVCPF